jgi:hypothetical protein
MGWQAVQAAMDVGNDLTEKKLETPHGEFVKRVGQMGVGRSSVYNLMRLALHRALIEEHKPDSMRGAFMTHKKAGLPRPFPYVRVVPLELGGVVRCEVASFARYVYTFVLSGLMAVQTHMRMMFVYLL